MTSTPASGTTTPGTPTPGTAALDVPSPVATGEVHRTGTGPAPHYDQHRLQLSGADLDVALGQLVGEEVISREQAGAVRVAIAAAATGADRSRFWVELAGYLGGVLMLGSVSVLLSLSWTSLTDAGRAGLLLLVALALTAAALGVAGGPTALLRIRRARPTARRRVTALLLALACAPAAGATGVLAHTNEPLLAGAVGLAVAAAGYALVPSTVGLLAAAIMSILVGTGVAVRSEHTLATTGVAMLVVGAVWLITTLIGVTVPAQVGYALGASIALLGTQELRGGDDLQTATGALIGLVVAGVCFGLYQLRRVTALLVVGVVAVAIAAPELVWDLTNGAIGGAAILFVAGAILICASLLGLRWRRRSAPGRAG